IAFEAFDDTTRHFHVLMRDMTFGITRIPSIQGVGTSQAPDLSGDGHMMVFSSDAPNLVPGDNNAAADIFLYDWQSDTLKLISVATGGEQANSLSEDPVISSDGRFVAFTSYATNLVPNDTNNEADIFLRDLVAGTTIRVSTSSTGEQANKLSTRPSLTRDGSKVAFQSLATNLASNDTGFWDVFVKDVVSGTVTRVSRDPGG